jgi:hypothetical protein
LRIAVFRHTKILVRPGRIRTADHLVRSSKGQKNWKI